MSKPARYSITYGLSGCYMPDSHLGAMEFFTRKELASFIRYELSQLDWPESMFAEVKIRKLWRFIARNGSSVAHFSLEREGYALSFYGLTRDEYREQAEA